MVFLGFGFIDLPWGLGCRVPRLVLGFRVSRVVAGAVEEVGFRFIGLSVSYYEQLGCQNLQGDYCLWYVRGNLRLPRRKSPLNKP